MKKTRAMRKKSINNTDLPNDVDALKQLLLAAEEKLKDRESVVSKQQNHIRHLEEIVKLFKANKFGKSSEKSPGQTELFDEVETECCDSEESWVAEGTSPLPQPMFVEMRFDNRGRDCPRSRIRIDLHLCSRG